MKFDGLLENKMIILSTLKVYVHFKPQIVNYTQTVEKGKHVSKTKMMMMMMITTTMLMIEWNGISTNRTSSFSK